MHLNLIFESKDQTSVFFYYKEKSLFCFALKSLELLHKNIVMKLVLILLLLGTFTCLINS